MPYKERASITLPRELALELEQIKDKHQVTWGELFAELTILDKEP